MCLLDLLFEQTLLRKFHLAQIHWVFQGAEKTWQSNKLVIVEKSLHHCKWNSFFQQIQFQNVKALVSLMLLAWKRAKVGSFCWIAFMAWGYRTHLLEQWADFAHTSHLETQLIAQFGEVGACDDCFVSLQKSQKPRLGSRQSPQPSCLGFFDHLT